MPVRIVFFTMAFCLIWGGIATLWSGANEPTEPPARLQAQAMDSAMFEKMKRRFQERNKKADSAEKNAVFPEKK